MLSPLHSSSPSHSFYSVFIAIDSALVSITNSPIEHTHTHNIHTHNQIKGGRINHSRLIQLTELNVKQQYNMNSVQT